MMRVCKVRSATAWASAVCTASSSTWGGDAVGVEADLERCIGQAYIQNAFQRQALHGTGHRHACEKASRDMLSLTSANRCSSPPKL
jgi:hypothetical protein